MDIKGDLLLWFTNLTFLNFFCVNLHANNERPLDLAEELHKPIIRKLIKRTAYSRFKDSIWGAYLAYMQLICKFNKGFRFSLCVIDIFK